MHKSQGRRDEKGSKKGCGRSRAVGQMFKQTSNYLNSICDLRGVPALESIVLLLPPPSVHLSGPSVLSLFRLIFRAPAEDVVGLRVHVKSTRHAFRSLPVLSPDSPLRPADSDRQPFPILSLSLSFSLSLFLPRLYNSISRNDGVAMATDKASIKIREKE